MNKEELIRTLAAHAATMSSCSRKSCTTTPRSPKSCATALTRATISLPLAVL